MKSVSIIKFVLICIILATSFISTGQYIDPIKTHVPYLSVTSYAAVGAMADISVVATCPTLNNYAFYSNPALNNRKDKLMCLDVSLMPFTFKGITDNYISQFGLTHAFNEKNSVSVSGLIYERYISNIWTTSPQLKDFILHGKYSYSINKKWAIGIAGKYFFTEAYFSNATLHKTVDRVHSYAIDLGVIYENEFYLNKHKFSYSLGTSLIDFGPKITYELGVNKDKDFISTKLLLGGVINTEIGKGFNFYIAYQADKQLVPTIYEINIPDGAQYLFDPDITAFEALYKSFYDAEGGFSEEMSEIVHKSGIETIWDLGATSYLAVRAGYAMNKQNDNLNSYGTVGLGIGYLGFSINARALVGNYNTSYNHTISIGYRMKFTGNQTLNHT